MSENYSSEINRMWKFFTKNYRHETSERVNVKFVNSNITEHIYASIYNNFN